MFFFSFFVLPQTLSLPVVVIVHGVQEPQAWATITWDNASAEPVSHHLLFITTIYSPIYKTL